jgi:hypothetical protein
MSDRQGTKHIETGHCLTLAGMVLLVPFSGCAAREAQKRLKEYEGVFEPMVGKARLADVVLKFGEPLRKNRIGSIEL